MSFSGRKEAFIPVRNPPFRVLFAENERKTQIISGFLPILTDFEHKYLLNCLEMVKFPRKTWLNVAKFPIFAPLPPIVGFGIVNNLYPNI
jgi:hypothetical protein